MLVILGNPPYSGHSTNVYERGQGILPGGRKAFGREEPKWLQDDYVKFIRFAQWRKIDQAGEGFWIYHKPQLPGQSTFRGMRRSLMKELQRDIYPRPPRQFIEEGKCLDGSRDENVFGIQQGCLSSWR